MSQPPSSLLSHIALSFPDGELVVLTALDKFTAADITLMEPSEIEFHMYDGDGTYHHAAYANLHEASKLHRSTLIESICLLFSVERVRRALEK